MLFFGDYLPDQQFHSAHNSSCVCFGRYCYGCSAGSYYCDDSYATVAAGDGDGFEDGSGNGGNADPFHVAHMHMKWPQILFHCCRPHYY